MVQSKVLKQLSILEQRKFDDEDIVEDVSFLNDKLQASVQDLRYSFLLDNWYFFRYLFWSLFRYCGVFTTNVKDCIIKKTRSNLWICMKQIKNLIKY